jgi:glycosyltransferase involved in cell wall biosynthesis
VGRKRDYQRLTPHLLHVFPSFGIGGMPLRTVRVIAHLAARCRHTVISLDGVTTAAELIPAGTTVEILPMVVDKRRPLSNLLGFRRFLASTKPDLLATYNWGAIEWAAVNRVRPLCRHIHFEAGFGREEATRQLRRRIIARRFVLATSDAVVVPSRTLEHIALDVWRLSRQRVRYIPDGIDVARFIVGKRLDDETRRSGHPIVIGTVAPLRPEKNIARLIEVFARIADDPRFQLVIAGDGPERVGLEKLAAARQLDHRITFLGHVSRPEDVLASFDIFTLSSETEQIPNAMLEAMAAGLPIASVDVGDVGRMVAAANHPYIVPRDRPDAFASALRQLAADPALRQDLGAQNRERAEQHFGQDQMFQQYEELLLGGLS